LHAWEFQQFVRLAKKARDCSTAHKASIRRSLNYLKNLKTLKIAALQKIYWRFGRVTRIIRPPRNRRFVSPGCRVHRSLTHPFRPSLIPHLSRQ
jgi:hypothetical protein